MERRRSKRKKVNIKLEIKIGDKSYPGVIENISENGLNFGTSSEGLLSASTRFNAGNEFEVTFQIPDGETLKLHCKVIWSFKTAPLGVERKVGAEVIFPPPAYIAFYNSIE